MNPFTLETAVSHSRLVLPEEVTVADAAALLEALRGPVAAQQPVVLDATRLGRIDAAGLQVVWAAARATRVSVLAAPGGAWEAALQRYGLAEPFQSILSPNPS